MSPPRPARDVLFQLIFRASNIGVGVLTTVVIVRTLGEEGFGQWATLFAVLGLVSFGLGGLANVTVERAVADRENSASWVGALLTLRLTASPPLSLITLLVCLVVANSTAMRIAALVIITSNFTAALAAIRIVFQLQVRNALVSAVELVGGIAWAAATVTVAVLGGGLVGMAVAFAVVTNATNITLVVLSLRAHPIHVRGSRRHWRPLLRLGLPVGLASVLTLGYARIDQLLVFQIAGDAEAGLYGSVYLMYERLQFLPGTLMTTLFPIFVAARRDSAERARRLFNTAIDYLLLVSLPGLAITLAGPEDLVVLLFGEDFAEAGPALPILMAAFVLVALGHLTGYLVIAYQLQRRFVAVALVALAFNVGANLLLIPEYGFIAAAWITLATEVIVLSLSLLMVCRRMQVVPTGTRLVRIVAASLGVGVLAWALRQAGLPVVAWAALAAVAYLPLILALGAVRWEEARSLFQRAPAR